MVSTIILLMVIAGIALPAGAVTGYLPTPSVVIKGHRVGTLAAYIVVAVVIEFFAVWGWYSTVQPGGNEIALLDRVYFCKPIKEGRNIALEGECGRQARIIMPGLKVESWIGFLYNIKTIPMIDVPDGHYAVLSAKDGLKLDEGQVAAKPWLIGNHAFTNDAGKNVTGDMLDATFFLTDGMGRKGPQATVLTPGRYPINTYLMDVSGDVLVGKTDNNPGTLSMEYVRTTVLTGQVGVVKSAIDESVVPSFVQDAAGTAVSCSASNVEEKSLGQIKAVLVPVGCRGVWKHPLTPGDYFINKLVYHVENVETRVQNWTYEGGYTRRVIELTVDNKGGITQVAHDENVTSPAGAAGESVAIKVEGWTVYQAIRLQARVRPDDAPLVVAAVGDLKAVEDRIITPQVQSVLRDVGGSRIEVTNAAEFDEAKSELDALKARLEVLKDLRTDVGMNPEQRAQETADLEKQIAAFKLPEANLKVTRPTRVLDFQNERAALEKLSASDIQKIGNEAGIDIVNVTFGNTDIPPELLVARKIEQLSGQLRNAYTQMRTAQVQRQSMEAATALADQQHDLVTAQIKVQTSELGIKSRNNAGIGEQQYLEHLALGQRAQVDVLGQDRVLTFNIVQEVLNHPEAIAAIHFPSTFTLGGGMDAASTILSATKLFGGPAAK
jgi:hypothetical protein